MTPEQQAALDKVMGNSSEVYKRLLQVIQPTDILPAVNNAFITASAYWLAQLIHMTLKAGVHVTPEEVIDGWFKDFQNQALAFHTSFIVDERDQAQASGQVH